MILGCKPKSIQVIYKENESTGAVDTKFPYIPLSMCIFSCNLVVYRILGLFKPSLFMLLNSLSKTLLIHLYLLE